jgi:hypothetical protein
MRHKPLIPLRIALLVGLMTGLVGCGMFAKSAPPPRAAAPVVSPLALGDGVTAASLDTTSDAEKAAALAEVRGAGERALGTVSVALGSPTEPGFWIRTKLVSVAAKGRVETADGKSVGVDLLPSEGAAILSFAAFRALELALTDLPDVTVYAD